MVSDNDYDRDDEIDPTEFSVVKKRRLNGACDACRRKKVRCDSAVMPGNKCSNCIASSIECTHTPRRTKAQERESNRDSYIRALEERLNNLEQLLRLPRQPETESALPTSPVRGDRTRAISDYSALKSPSPHTLPLSHNSPASDPDAYSEGDTTEADDLAHVALAEHLRNMSVQAIEDRFFGQSSTFMFIKHASVVKQKITGDDKTLLGPGFRRPIYWDIRPWERVYADNAHASNFVYPDLDLIYHLMHLYFDHVNIYFPLLHRPTFQQLVSEGLHLRDTSFGATLLMVCAVASRYSDDPQVILPEDAPSRLSAGWKFFEQVPVLRNYFIDKITLYDVQYYCLAVIYVLGSGIPHAAWNVLGLGIRFAQERGMHRRRGAGQSVSVEDELSKRAFWCLVSMDRMMSTFSGRPCAIQEEDFDIDLPTECDDEYWEIHDTIVTFRQPKGRPSRVSAFVAQLKLCEILAFALRTLYSTKKSKILSGLVGSQWEQRIVGELDSAMNNWKDSLPEHLTWDPYREERTFFEQSATLHGFFYQIQIQIHRPFLQKSSPLSLASLTICTNAARSCSHLLDALGKKSLAPFPHSLMGAFVSGVVLLLNIWGGSKAGVAAAPQKGLADLEKCMYILKLSEARWHVAGRLWDMLKELATMRHDMIPSDLPSNKRQRDSQEHCEKTRIPTNIQQPHGTVVEPQMSGNFEVASQSLDPSVWTHHTPLQMPEAFGDPNFFSPQEWSPPIATKQADRGPQVFGSTAVQTTPMMATTESPSLRDINDDTMSMWFSVPASFNVNDWQTFISELYNPMSGGSYS
ncbi:hypothetical protein AMATHDRAFT_54332 [Amanita thiersii Skay4041]|uniref:Zn(2)-C6 fungal-type domain-containing protein n=1 Tax=Amanita thiersii Skay4041 TaxID=703135 RepID=A0A2A9NZ12_9AGAR|nr:hypothetical protein AMATHDRAFT_54332 [Amanita thiersii Skay4041]